jgi:hypothetical protein
MGSELRGSGFTLPESLKMKVNQNPEMWFPITWVSEPDLYVQINQQESCCEGGVVIRLQSRLGYSDLDPGTCGVGRDKDGVICRLLKPKLGCLDKRIWRDG